MTRIASWLAILATGFLGAAAQSSPMPVERLPPPLRPWVEWVLHGHETAACPRAFNDPGIRSCAWPAELTLDLTERGGTFRQRVDAFANDTVIALPGDAEAWPQEVKVDGNPAPVLLVQGRPTLRLAPGRYRITGILPWNKLPPSITVPAATGILKTTLNGAPLAALPDAEGRIWLRKTGETPSDDALSMRTFRHFDDGVPIHSTVRYELTVAGKPREIRLPAAVFKSWLPASIESPLPARIDADGTATVQARAGTWVVMVGSRLMASTKEFGLPAEATNEEVWALQSHNEIRVVTAEGLPAVDPKNVGAPAEWAAFPTFLARPGSTLKLVEARRGNAAGDADKLGIARTFWLDFDGNGYTVQDRLTGRLGRTWRLELPPTFDLGRVAVGGQDQPITTIGQGSGKGVELRHASLALEADSRIESSARTLPASGWKADIAGWTGTLNLPPGWRLLHVSGVDSVQGAWLDAWTLWDIFFVTIIVAGTFRLFGLPATLLMAAGLILSWHESDIPVFPWVGIVVVSAISRGLPEGRLQTWTTRARATFALLALIFLIPFAVSQVRQALYPSLQFQNYVTSAPAAKSAGEPGARNMGQARLNEVDEAKAKAEQLADKVEAMVNAPLPATAPAEPGRLASSAYSNRRYDQIDPNAKSLTGPGIPNWTWQSFGMSIQGPIAVEQTLGFVVLPPWAHAAWGLLSVIALALALWRTCGFSPWRISDDLRNLLGKTALLALAVGVSLGHSGEAQAAKAAAPVAVADPGIPSSPPAAILGELRERLTAPAACMPGCAELSRLSFAASGDRIVVRAQYHAQALVSVPLPGQGAGARPSTIVAGTIPVPLRRDESGTLWAVLSAGVTDIVLELAADRLSEIPVMLPMVPRQLVADLSGWSLTGLDARGLATGSAQLIRQAPAKGGGANEASGKDTLPPLIRVERRISLGQNWTIATQIVREGQSRAPATVRVPLLSGESVTDPAIKVDNGVALVELGQNAGAGFASSLKQGPAIRIKAASLAGQIESWILDASPYWHVEMTGIPPVFQKRGEEWMPTWLPWPGEEFQLSVAKPGAIDGSTITVDAVALRSVIGKRSSDLSAEIRLRAGTGGNHTFLLPENAQLLAVAIDGSTQPLRSEGRKLAVPVTPGAHLLKIEWRDVNGIGASYSAPRIDLGLPAVNALVELNVPQDRVVLMTSGPVMGPAVLLWGMLIVTMVLAVVASRNTDTPLRMIDWLLLGVGLMQWSITATALVAGWFLVMALRKRAPAIETAWKFNLVQIGLVAFTLLAAGALLSVLKNGLLGYPDLLVQGNGSSAFLLRWYQDRIGTLTPQATVFSIPVTAYRVIMLLWALWLAFSLMKWIRWGWSCYASSTYWKATGPIFRRQSEAAETVAAGAAAESQADATPPLPESP